MATARPKTAATMPPAGKAMFPAALSVAEAAAELAEEAADERAAADEDVASASVAVAVELPVVEDEPLEVATVALEELEVELYALAALHHETLVCSAPKRLGSEGYVSAIGSMIHDVMGDFGLTGWAIVIAGQDGTLVVTEAVPILGITAADSGAGGGKAVGDDAVANVRYAIILEG